MQDFHIISDFLKLCMKAVDLTRRFLSEIMSLYLITVISHFDLPLEKKASFKEFLKKKKTWKKSVNSDIIDKRKCGENVLE